MQRVAVPARVRASSAERAARVRQLQHAAVRRDARARVVGVQVVVFAGEAELGLAGAGHDRPGQQHPGVRRPRGRDRHPDAVPGDLRGEGPHRPAVRGVRQVEPARADVGDAVRRRARAVRPRPRRVRVRRGVGAGGRADPGVRADRGLQPHRLQLDRVLPRARRDEADRRPGRGRRWSTMLGIAVPLLLVGRARRPRARDGARHGDRPRSDASGTCRGSSRASRSSCTRRARSRRACPLRRRCSLLRAATDVDRSSVARARRARALRWPSRSRPPGRSSGRSCARCPATSARRRAPRNLPRLDVEAQIASNPLWYHTLELGPGRGHPRLVRPAPDRRPAAVARRRAASAASTSGTYDGFLAFELERRGAAEVVAIDIEDHSRWDWPARTRALGPERLAEIAGERKGLGFDIAKEALGSSVERGRARASTTSTRRARRASTSSCAAASCSTCATRCARSRPSAACASARSCRPSRSTRGWHCLRGGARPPASEAARACSGGCRTSPATGAMVEAAGFRVIGGPRRYRSPARQRPSRRRAAPRPCALRAARRAEGLGSGDGRARGRDRRARLVPHARARAGRRDAGLARPARHRRPDPVPGVARRQALPRCRHLQRVLGVRDGAPRCRRGGGDRRARPGRLGLARGQQRRMFTRRSRSGTQAGPASRSRSASWARRSSGSTAACTTSIRPTWASSTWSTWAACSSTCAIRSRRSSVCAPSAAAS